MNENIDLTKILKDCPSGWKFYSSIYGDVKFLKVGNDTDYPIKFSVIYKDGVERNSSVSKQGLFLASYDGECAFFPSREQRNWSKFTAPWLKKEKFDPKTLKSFDKVICRNGLNVWHCDFFSSFMETWACPYVCSGGSYTYCIPYNDDTKHLVGTNDDAPEYYEYWVD